MSTTWAISCLSSPRTASPPSRKRRRRVRGGRRGWLEPIFTPTTKADEGHDENITFEQAVQIAGEPAANAMALRSLAVYRFGRDYAPDRGIIIPATKLRLA